MRRLLLLTLLVCLSPGWALAQSAPNWPYGYIPQALNWNNEFAGKQDYPATTAIPLFGWTSYTRPAGPEAGWLGYNSTLGVIEWWNGLTGSWVSASGGGGAGNVNGPGATTLGYVPTWNNTNGTLLGTGWAVGTSGAALPLLNGANAWSGDQTFSGITETPVALTGCNGATATINFTAGTVFSCTVSTGPVTFALANTPAAGHVGEFTLDLTNGGAETITWPTGTVWPGGTPPTLTAAGRDVVTCFIHDGSTLNCFPSGLNMH